MKITCLPHVVETGDDASWKDGDKAVPKQNWSVVKYNFLVGYLKRFNDC